METQFKLMSEGAAASLSMADANFDGIKYHDDEMVDTPNRTLTWVTGIAAAAGVLTGLMAMWIDASIYTFVAFAFPLVTAPLVIAQRRKIQWLPTFREESNKLRLEVNDMAMQRNRLSNENNRLERQVKRMSAVEERFEHLVKREGKDVAAMRQAVQENVNTQQEIKKLQASRALLDLFAVILKSDKQGDDEISNKDLDEFMMRVRTFASRRGKPLDEKAIREAFKFSLTRTGASLYNITSSMMEDEEIKEEDIESPAPAPAQAPALEVPVAAPKRQAPTREEPLKVSTPETPAELPASEDFEALQKVPSVRDTGLVLRNTESMRSEGQAPKSIFGGMDPPAQKYMDPPAKSTDDLMLDGLLGSNSKDYDAAKKAEDDKTDGLLGTILKSFSGGAEQVKPKPPVMSTVMSVVSTNISV